MKFYKIISGNKFLYITRILISIFVFSYIIVIPIKVIPIVDKNLKINNQDSLLSYNGVLEVWNIDTFEGGSISRTRWLEKRSLEFEKENKGCFIVVKNMTQEQAIINISNGKLPNMFSYGFGFGNKILNYIEEYSGRICVRDDLIISGYKDNKLLAVPYILGGYIIASEQEIENDLKNLYFGGKNLNNFAVALALNNFCATNLNDSINNIDSFDAYDYFLNKKANNLCGTQRDAFRLNNKLVNGSIANLNINYLSNFTDLLQYISISRCSYNEKQICTKFIEFITSKEVQKTLEKISMFSVLNQTIYNQSDSYLNKMETVLANKLKTLNAFISDEENMHLHKLASEHILNKNKDINEIYKFLA